VVLILLETEHDEHAETPNLSRLATEGVFYAEGFAHSPQRDLARLALLSARTPLEAGVVREGQSAPPELPSLEPWLREHAPAGFSFELATFRGTHAQVDQDVGRLLDGLRAEGRYDDALIVLTSHRVSATGLTDAELRAPVVIRPPAGHPLTAELERAREKTARHIDVVPTVLDVLGLPELPGAAGTSLLEGTLRVLMAEAHGDEDLFCLRDDRYKLVFWPATGVFEMYDLETDPDETKDVFASTGGERAAWKRALVQAADRLAELRSDPK